MLQGCSLWQRLISRASRTAQQHQTTTAFTRVVRCGICWRMVLCCAEVGVFLLMLRR